MSVMSVSVLAESLNTAVDQKLAAHVRRAALELPEKARDTADLLDYLQARAWYAGTSFPDAIDLASIAPGDRLAAIADLLRGWARRQEHLNVGEGS